MTREEIKRIADKADIDVRTVTSFVAGVEVRPSSQRRIERAIKELKMKLPRRS